MGQWSWSIFSDPVANSGQVQGQRVGCESPVFMLGRSHRTWQEASVIGVTQLRELRLGMG